MSSGLRSVANPMISQPAPDAPQPVNAILHQSERISHSSGRVSSVAFLEFLARGGTGLGVSIIRKPAGMMGGDGLNVR
jgi:signal transduction histidine kinase